MATMPWNTSTKGGMFNLSVTRFPGVAFIAMAALFGAPDVFAQAALGGQQAVTGICALAGWFKIILGAVAIVAGLIYIINSFFTKSNVLGDIITNVLLGCLVAGVLGYLVSLTLGVGTQCAGI